MYYKTLQQFFIDHRFKILGKAVLFTNNEGLKGESFPVARKASLMGLVVQIERLNIKYD